MYIGQTVQSLDNRWRRHILSTQRGSDHKFHRAIRKYGEENFLVEEVLIVSTPTKEILKKKLDYVEMRLIKKLETHKCGYNSTDGGEGGRSLSGGEQRRLSLARALLHDAPLLLLDEVTEGLDPATEQRIMQLVIQHCIGKSVLMITHRLTGLEQMDRIALLENGRFRITATHDELLRQDRYYQQLFHHLNDE
jgi:ABC-type transport system involved in cytochrome bd biosynthesis fused ATPase/permease subunit